MKVSQTLFALMIVGSSLAVQADPRPIPEGVTVIKEIKAKSGLISLTPDSEDDHIDVVTGVATGIEGTIANGFGLGVRKAREKKTPKCLLVSLQQTSAPVTWKQWMLCGDSPIAAMHTDEKSSSDLVKFLPKVSAVKEMPKDVRNEVLGGLVELETEAWYGMLFMTKAGPAFREMPGGQ